jgi:hypothetical protein
MDMETMGLIAVIDARIEQLQGKARAAEERLELQYRAEVAPFQVAVEELGKVRDRLVKVNPVAPSSS